LLSFRTVASCDPRAAVFELRQFVLGDSFPHYVHGGFWAGFRWRRHGSHFFFERSPKGSTLGVRKLVSRLVVQFGRT